MNTPSTHPHLISIYGGHNPLSLKGVRLGTEAVCPLSLSVRLPVETNVHR